MDEIPTFATLTRVLRGAPHVPGAGVVVPNSLLSTFVPNDVIDLIVQRVGPRGAPASLRRQAEQFWLFLQNHSLRYLNEVTGERADFNAARLEWWRQFCLQMRNIGVHHLFDIRMELRALETPLHSSRANNDLARNEWLAKMDSADNVEYVDSANATVNAFNGWANQLLQECQHPDVNCLQIDFHIPEPVDDDDEHAGFGYIQQYAVHPAVRSVLEQLPRNSYSEPSKISVVVRNEQGFYRVSLVLYSPLFVAASALPREPMFDALAWLRNNVLVVEPNAPNFDPHLLFPVRTQSLNPQVAAQEAASRQQSRQVWLQMVNILRDNRQLYMFDYDVMTLNLDAESHEPRSNATAENMMSATRDARLHLTMGEYDIAGATVAAQPEAALVEDVEALMAPEQEWNTIHLQLTITHNDTVLTQQQVLRYLGVAQCIEHLRWMLQLPNAQVSVVVQPLANWSYVTILLYSPDFVIDCAQAAQNRHFHMGATLALMQTVENLV